MNLIFDEFNQFTKYKFVAQWSSGMIRASGSFLKVPQPSSKRLEIVRGLGFDPRLSPFLFLFLFFLNPSSFFYFKDVIPLLYFVSAVFFFNFISFFWSG